MRCPRITPAHLSLALASVAVTTAGTAWATANGHHTTSGAWSLPVVVGWVLTLLSLTWVLVVGCWGMARLIARLFRPKVRPAPGAGGRRPSLTPEQWAVTDEEYRNRRTADAWARHNSARMGDTQPMLLADVAELYDRQPMLIDDLDAYGITPKRVVRAGAASADDWTELPDVRQSLGFIAEQDALRAAEVPSTVWTVEPAGLSGQGATLRTWFGDAFERRAA